jgi:hypothetical protein
MFRKAFMFAATAALAGALALPAAAQVGWRNAQYNGAYNDNKAYQQGYREGQEDRAHGSQVPHNHTWKNNSDAGAYAAGYRDGYNNGRTGNWSNNNGWGQNGRSGDNDRWHDRDHDRWRNQGNWGNNNGRWNNSGSYGNVMRQAQQVGYRDGVNDGQHDRSTGHSFRPTQDDNYKNADRGYTSSYGDKQQYKNAYRQGYEQGYQQGYNGGHGWRR